LADALANKEKTKNAPAGFKYTNDIVVEQRTGSRETVMNYLGKNSPTAGNDKKFSFPEEDKVQGIDNAGE